MMAKQSLPHYDAEQYWTNRDFHTSARLASSLIQEVLPVVDWNMTDKSVTVGYTSSTGCGITNLATSCIRPFQKIYRISRLLR
jgi:hypothetical protein